MPPAPPPTGLFASAHDAAVPSGLLDLDLTDLEPLFATAPAEQGVVEAVEALLREHDPNDFDVLIIGAGPGGYAAALRAAQLGCYVGLVEERQVGGVCLNRGCIPAKSLLESAGVLRLLRRASEYGIRVEGGVFPQLDVMHARKSEVVAYLRDHVTRMLEEAGVVMLNGRARFNGERSVLVTSDDGERTLTAEHIVIATGGRPARLPVPGAELPGALTSDDVLEMLELPEHLAVVGAGAVGIEFAYFFREMGSQCTLLEASGGVMPQEDREIQAEMEKALTGVGVRLEKNARLQHIEPDPGGLRLVYLQEGHTRSLLCQYVLLATGRLANVDDMGLLAAGITVDAGKIVVDEHLCTSVPQVYAVGDCIRRAGWAHRAAVEGRMVVERIKGHPSQADTRFTPSCYYTHPEVASVGLTLTVARDLGIEAECGRFPFRENGRAAAAGEHTGFVKVVFERGSEKLLGCQIIGPHATDIINEAVVALRCGWNLEQMISTIHAHPTFAEALPGAALDGRRSQGGEKLEGGDLDLDGTAP